MAEIKRNPTEAKRVIREAYPYKVCTVCGTTLAAALDIAHLNHDPSNNDPDNLAWLCKTHHWMFDCDLYPLEAIKLMRDRWQVTKGRPDHSGRMKDAGKKAAATRRRSAAAQKSWETRRRKNG